MTAMYSNPASSAIFATVASSFPSASGPRGVLKSGICTPIFIDYLRVYPNECRALVSRSSVQVDQDEVLERNHQ